MRLHTLSIVSLASLVALIGSTRTEAAPIVAIGPTNTGISSLSFSVVGTTININEIWTSSAIGVLRIEGLEADVDYTVVKNVTNNSGESWTRLANELLDPAGQPNDADDPQPYPAFVPAGYSTSNDFDGLSFAQGSGLPRTSTAFSMVFADEDTDARDFLDYFNGTVNSGGLFSLTFGLRDNLGVNQPFLLVERPNVTSRNPVPEPASLLLMGTGLLAVRRRIYRMR